MTYKGSNWTRGELGNVPDENPSVPCADCGKSFRWRDYWKPRVVDGDRVEEPNDPDEPWRCDDCHDRYERRTRRRQNNQRITEWTA